MRKTARTVRSWQAARLLPGGGETGVYVIGLIITLEFIPTARSERPSPARANGSRDLSERCPDPLLRDAVDHRKVGSSKLALQDIIEDGKRLVGFEHPGRFLFPDW